MIHFISPTIQIFLTKLNTKKTKENQEQEKEPWNKNMT